MYIYTGVPKLSDVPDDLRWSLCNNINKVLNESNVLEPYQNHPLPLICGKLSSTKLVSGSRKIGHHCIYRLLYQTFILKNGHSNFNRYTCRKEKKHKTTLKWSPKHKGREQIGWNEKKTYKNKHKTIKKVAIGTTYW